jgi:hypothetical protein
MPKRSSLQAKAVAGSEADGHLLIRVGTFLLLTAAGTALLALPHVNIQ